MATERLDFQMEEPGDDPLSDQLFDIMSCALQPDSKIPLTDVVTQLVALLPEGQPYSTDVYTWLMTCYEIAEQIPPQHPSMVKLVSIIDLCLHSSRFPTVPGSESMQTDPKYRTQKLGETLRDTFNTSRPEDDPAKYINFQAFIARLYEHGIIEYATLGKYTVQDAFESNRRRTNEAHDLTVRAASQYLLLVSDAIYREVLEGDIQHARWQRWYTEMCAVAATDTNDTSSRYSPETVQLAGRAVVAMDAVQRLKSG